MTMQGRIRLGILALPVSGLLATISTLLPGVFTNPAVDPQGFAQTAGTNALGNMIGIVSLVILLIGLQALYSFLANASSDKLAFTGWIATLVGVGLFLPLAGILAFEAPIAGSLYLSGDRSAVMVIAKSISLTNSPAFVFGSVAGVLASIGSALFGVAIWRSGSISRVSGLLYALSITLSFLSAPFYSFILGLLGGLLLLVSGLWIAASIMKNRSFLDLSGSRKPGAGPS